jgi:hypothetical protein
MAVTSAEPDWLYVITATGTMKGIYKSTDRGSTFIEVLDGATINLLAYDDTGAGSTGQGSYDLALAASPIDANTIVVGGINTWRSEDGGLNWTLVSHWANGGVQVVHADKHSLRFRAMVIYGNAMMAASMCRTIMERPGRIKQTAWPSARCTRWAVRHQKKMK